MRAVVQRVEQARVIVDNETAGAIDLGLLVYVGVAKGDQLAQSEWLARKISDLRIFPSEKHAIDRSLIDSGGSALIVSQFTLLADVQKGRRPSFVEAAPAELAEPLIKAVCERLLALGVTVAEGRFGAHMQVKSTNDGPVTIILDSED
jgi:D-tyrosyl-tRNA(Tyr) deacylase